MYCTSCGRPLPPGARFCPRCGAPAPAPTQPQADPYADPHADPYAAPDPYADPYADEPPVRPDTRPLDVPARPTVHRAPLVAAGLLTALALAGVGWLLLSGDGADPAASPAASGTPSTSASASASPSVDPRARQQARDQDALLDRTAQNRDAVSTAVTALQACTTPPAQARQVFEKAADDRRDLLEDVADLDLSALPEGTRLRGELSTALQGSADADDAFAAWAARQEAGCVPGAADPDLARGLQLSAQTARPAKERFVAVWNPVARRYGLGSRTATEL